MAKSAPAPVVPAGVDLPLGLGEFTAALDALGPFETNPNIAVAVSGGRDSLALTVLAAEWVKARNGQLIALIVDHGLRAESTEEARLVAARLDALGIVVKVLAWLGDKPDTGLAEAARVARYRLLQDWCAKAGVVHLLLAHQRDDQAETVFLRLGDASGMDGLAGMASVRELDQVRLVRPLLDVPRGRLTATLAARGLSWVDDPTNGNLRYLRPRLRQAMRPDLSSGAIAVAERFAADRTAIDRRLAALLADSISLHQDGWLSIDRASLAALPVQLAVRLLSRAIATIGGRAYPPRRAAILIALKAIAAHRGATAGGCRVIVKSDAIVVTREWGAIGEVIAVSADKPVEQRWDGRFAIALQPRQLGRIAALGESGRLAVLHQERFAGAVRQRIAALPATAAAALPAFWIADKSGKIVDLREVGDGGRLDGGPATLAAFQSGRLVAVFRPDRPLAPSPHALVLAGQRLI